MKLIGVGDNVVDVYLDQNKYYPGGNCVNVAVSAKRNGAEASAYLGVFGTDAEAEHIKWALGQEDIDYVRSRTVHGASGHPQVNITEEGDRVFVGGPQDTVQHIVKLKLCSADLEYIRAFDVAHVSCYSSMEEELGKLSQIVPVSFDFSDRLSLEYLQTVCPYIEYGFFSGSDLSDKELETLIDRVSEYALRAFVITRGSKPAVCICEGKRYLSEPLKIEVVDTMGAGDSFIGAFLRYICEDVSTEIVLEKAKVSAASTCTYHGGFGYPKANTP